MQARFFQNNLFPVEYGIKPLVDAEESIKLFILEGDEIFDFVGDYGRDRYVLYFQDDKIQAFLRDWKEILFIYRSNTINEKLYNLWLQDKFEEYAKIPRYKSDAEKS